MTHDYLVAEHLFRVDIPDGQEFGLDNYAPFAVKPQGEPLFTLEVAAGKAPEPADLELVIDQGEEPGETVRSYPSFGGGRAADFLEKLSAVTDRTVIDCPSYLFSDPLSLAALRLSGGVVRLWSPDLRAPAYFQSVLKLLPEEKYRTGRHVRVLNLPDGEIPPPERETEAAMSGRESVFPHIKKLKCLFPEGGMLSAEARRLTKRPAEKILSFCDAGRDKK